MKKTPTIEYSNLDADAHLLAVWMATFVQEEAGGMPWERYTGDMKRNSRVVAKRLLTKPPPVLLNAMKKLLKKTKPRKAAAT